MRKVKRAPRPHERRVRHRSPLTYEDRIHIWEVNQHAIGNGWLINRRVQRPDGRWWRCLSPGPKRHEAYSAVRRLREEAPEATEAEIREVKRLLDGITRKPI